MDFCTKEYLKSILSYFCISKESYNACAIPQASGTLIMLENINHAIACIFEMREQVAEMAGKNYGNLKAHRK